MLKSNISRGIEMQSNDNPKHARFLELVNTAKLIPRAYLKDEVELLLRKWPGYRFMSPWQTTELFHKKYVSGYKRYLRETVDLEISQISTVGEKIDWSRPNRFLTQLWGARMIADWFGAPYEDYLEFAFHFAQRRTRRQGPQPNQLGPNDKTDFAWRAEWVKFWDMDRIAVALLRMPPMLQYATTNYRDLPAQNCFRMELRNALETAPHKGSFISRWVVGRRALTERDCLSLVRSEQLDRMLVDARIDVKAGRLGIVNYPEANPADLWQSCFAVPGVDTARESVCGVCALRDQCDSVRDLCLRTVRKDTATIDPITEERRRKGRDRVRRHRMKVKLHS